METAATQVVSAKSMNEEAKAILEEFPDDALEAAQKEGGFNSLCGILGSSKLSTVVDSAVSLNQGLVLLPKAMLENADLVKDLAQRMNELSSLLKSSSDQICVKIIEAFPTHIKQMAKPKPEDVNLFNLAKSFTDWSAAFEAGFCRQISSI